MALKFTMTITSRNQSNLSLERSPFSYKAQKHLSEQTTNTNPRQTHQLIKG